MGEGRTPGRVQRRQKGRGQFRPRGGLRASWKLGSDSERGTVPSLPQSPLQELLLSEISQQIPKGLDRTSLAV